MDLSELARTVEKIAESESLLRSRREYRDRQIREALAAGITWAQVQAVTGLSKRGIQLAIKRV